MYHQHGEATQRAFGHLLYDQLSNTLFSLFWNGEGSTFLQSLPEGRGTTGIFLASYVEMIQICESGLRMDLLPTFQERTAKDRLSPFKVGPRQSSSNHTRNGTPLIQTMRKEIHLQILTLNPLKE